MNYIPSWLNDTYTLLQKLQKCIEKIENISNKEIPDAIKPIQTEIESIKTDIASLETDCAFVNKVNTFTKPQVIRRGKESSLGFKVEEQGTGTESDYTDYSHGHITKTKNNKSVIYTYNLPDKAGDIALKSDIPTGGVVNGQAEIYAGNGEPAQVKMHAGSNSFDAYIEFKGGSGPYISRIYPFYSAPHKQVNYILPESNNISDDSEMQNLLSDKTVKTVLGTPIKGTGNITLHIHDIKMTLSGNNITGDVHMVVYSAKGVNVDSLADLKNLIGNTFNRDIFGTIYNNGTLCIPLYANQESLFYIDGNSLNTITFDSGTYSVVISDTVTTV